MEYPYLQQIYAARGGDDFVLLSIDNQNKPDLDREFAEKIGVTFPMLLDDKNVSKEVFKIRGTPANYVIDRDGRIVFRHLGFFPGQERVMEAEIEALIRKSATPST